MSFQPRRYDSNLLRRPRRVRRLDVVRAAPPLGGAEEPGGEVLRADPRPLERRHGLHPQRARRREADEVLLLDERTQAVDLRRARGHHPVGGRVVLRDLVLHAGDDLRLHLGSGVGGGRGLRGPELPVQADGHLVEPAPRSPERLRRAAVHLLRSEVRLERVGELLRVEVLAEAPGPRRLLLEVRLEELLVPAERLDGGDPGLLRGGVLPRELGELGLEELDPAGVVLDRLVEVDPGDGAERRAPLGEVPRQRAELRRRGREAVPLGPVAVGQVREARRHDLPRIVVREVVDEARVPGPFADLPELEELEGDPVRQDGGVRPLLRRELVALDPGERLLLRDELGDAARDAGRREVLDQRVVLPHAEVAREVRLRLEEAVHVDRGELLEALRGGVGGIRGAGGRGQDGDEGREQGEGRAHGPGL